MLRIRKLTEGECMRLMGFEEKDTEACREAGLSKANIYHQRGDIIEYLQTILAILHGRLADKMNFDEHSHEVTLFFDGELVIWRLKKGEFDLLRLWAEGKK